MPRFIDLTGEKFGRLTVIERAENIGRTTRWKCHCECGSDVIVRQPDLKSGRTQSCGCIHSEQLAERNRTHNLSKTRICNIWRGMKDRCYNPNCKAYKNYGERGIKVCDEWIHDLQAFFDWSMNNGYSENLTIDRIDVNGDYSPENCRWVDMTIQANNTRSNHLIACDGKTMTIAEWSRETGIKQHTIIRRLNLGWDIERALKTPV